MLKARRRAVLALAALGLAASCAPLAAEEAREASPATGARTAGGSSLFEGVDLSKPAQEAFRGWPPEALRSRAYWLPWSWLTLQRAKLFNRPVLFVMTVPWTRLGQRMLEETLSDPNVLQIVNEGYLAVLVRADRRPDIQERYQTGTWPVVAFLLPDGKPMLSQANPTGAALPITTGYVDADRLAFLLSEGLVYFDRWAAVLQGVGEVWAHREGGDDPKPGKVHEEATDTLARWLIGNADRQYGGFGPFPKFLVGGLSEYAALRAARQVPALEDHARLTIEKLLSSPLYDRREGGMHRLASSAEWGGIQYEKMLESNANLLRELVVQLRAGPADALQTALRDTARFLTTVLARPGGGFFLAQVADPTSPDGGRYWTAPPSEAAPAPPVDSLVLSGTNAIAGAALLRAGAWLGDEALERAGRGALDLVLEGAWERGRGAAHVIEPQPDDRTYLTAQADVAFGLVDAYESTGDARYLDAARDIVDFSLRNLVAAGETRLRDHIPDAQPLGILGNPRYPLPDNVRLARVMLRLTVHGAGPAYRQQAESILGSFVGDLTVYGMQGTEAALAVEEMIREPLRIRIEGRSDDAGARALRRAALGSPWPWTVVTAGPAPGEGGAAVAVLDWKGQTRRVERASDLAGAIRQVTGSQSQAEVGSPR